MIDFLALHAHEMVLLLSTLFGVWGLFLKFRSVIRTEILLSSATKEDLARVEGKVDVLLNILAAAPRRRKPKCLT